MHILSPEIGNCPSWISGRERMTVENISWSNLHKRMLSTRRGSNPKPPDHQWDAHPTEPPKPAWLWLFLDNFYDCNYFWTTSILFLYLSYLNHQRNGGEVAGVWKSSEAAFCVCIYMNNMVLIFVHIYIYRIYLLKIRCNKCGLSNEREGLAFVHSHQNINKSTNNLKLGVFCIAALH